jgi:3D (Asp-Asp-Asp) domain-containing protein
LCYNAQAQERGNYMSDAQLKMYHMLRHILGRRKLLLAVALLVTSLVVTGFVGSQKKVSILADGNTTMVSTSLNGPAEILAQANIYLGPKDEYGVSSPHIANGTSIQVYRAVPVTIVLQDKTEVITTGKPTVGQVATSLGYTTANSKTVPEENSAVTSMMEIHIIAVAEKLVTQTKSVDPEVIRQPDATMDKNEEELIQHGQAGTKEITTKLRFENGQQVTSEVVAEKVITPAIPTILKTGTRDSIETSRGTMRFKNVHVMEATAYTPYDGSVDGITATGIMAQHGVVAVDPNVIPLGTRLYIPGYGVALAADTGGAIIGNHIDLCVESLDEAWSYGRRTIKVYELAE